MRVAVCLAGHMREPEKTRPNLMRNLIEPNNADVFIHTWSVTYNVDNLRRDASLYGINTTKDNALAWNPVVFEIQHWHPDLVGNPRDKLPNIREAAAKLGSPNHRYKDAVPLMGMFYGIKRSIGLKSIHEGKYGFLYDVVVRCRPDLLLERPLIMEDIKPLDGIYTENIQTRATHEERIIHGMNDQIAFGPSRYMDMYGQTLDHLNDEIHLEHNTFWAPEQCLFAWINACGIDVIPYDVRHRIRRPMGYEQGDREYGRHDDDD